MSCIVVRFDPVFENIFTMFYAASVAAILVFPIVVCKSLVSASIPYALLLLPLLLLLSHRLFRLYWLRLIGRSIVLNHYVGRCTGHYRSNVKLMKTMSVRFEICIKKRIINLTCFKWFENLN